jgi:hypothetical protein
MIGIPRGKATKAKMSKADKIGKKSRIALLFI